MRKKVKRHKVEDDRTCVRCGWRVTPPIPHECDPSICISCGGRRTKYVGRGVDGKWVGYVDCVDCGGTGKTVWH